MYLGIFAVPFFAEFFQIRNSCLFIGGRINCFQISHEFFQVFIGNIFRGIANLVDNALLNLSVWINRFDCLRKAGKAIHTGDQDILNAAVFQAVHYGKPELGTFIFADIHAQDIFYSGHIYAYSDINSSFYNTSLAADMIMDGIHEDYRINFFQRSFLPFFDQWKDFISNTADCGIGNIYIIELAHMTLDIRCGHALGIHGEDLFLHILGYSILVFFYDLRFKFTFTVSGNVDIHVAITGMHSLF